jgi:light-regulated signal transduction histidine kinase (bacteriophytochrome)/CheY-like chemotaxis protein
VTTGGRPHVPLHAPEAVQTFGYLLAFRRTDGGLERCSANIAGLLGQGPADLAGRLPSDILSPAIAALIDTTATAPSGGTLLRERFLAPGGAPHSVIFFHTADHLVVEVEPADEDADATYELMCRTHTAIEVLRNIADPGVMMAKITQVFRDITGYDRILLFRFDRDWNRDVVGEERSPAATGRFLGLRVPADALPAVARRLYQRAGTRLIPDVLLPDVPVVRAAPGDGDGDPGPLDLSDSGLRSTSAEHAAHLNQLGVRASLTMAIEVAGHLWGMVTAHHYQPRRLSALRRAACRLLATSIAAPLAALEDSADSSAHTRRALEISRAASEALERPGSSETALVHFAQSLAGIAEATGVLVRAGTATASAGTLPARPVLDRIAALAATESDGGIFATESLSAADPSLAGVRDIASGAVGLDLPVPGGGILLLLRGEIAEEVVWARDASRPYSDSGPAWAVAVHSREAGGSVPVPDDAPRVERTRGAARGWPERLLPLLPIARQTVLDICRLGAERETLAAIRRRESELRTIYDSVDEGIALADGEGRVVSCNQQFATLAGLSADGAVGRRLDDLIAVTEPAGTGRLLAISRGKGHPRGPGAAQTTLELRATATGRGAGGLHTVVVRDISQRERFEAELVRAREAAERANRAKDEFLANMSHELRTPLTAVLGYIDLLDQQLRDPTQRKWVATIRRSGWSLLRLLSDVVDFARIDAGEIRLEFSVLDPVGKVHSIIDLYRPTMEEKGIRAEVQVAPGMPRAVIGDAARMRQVLGNLIGNAVKFTREGTIAIAVEAGPADADGQIDLTFSISDTGIGIAPENLGALFDRFSQADASSTRPFGGVGLGLAIARGLARRMGGDIRAESAGLGQGARFRLNLPVRSATRAAPAGAPAVVRPRARGGLLIIEDDPVNQELLAEMTRILGFVPEVAGTGELGVETAAARPDLAALLVDVSLPGMNGLEAIRRIRALDSSVARAPILCVTALASEKDRAAALAAGADAYLTKPVRLADLRQALERETAGRPGAATSGVGIEG